MFNNCYNPAFRTTHATTAIRYVIIDYDQIENSMPLGQDEHCFTIVQSFINYLSQCWFMIQTP